MFLPGSILPLPSSSPNLGTLLGQPFDNQLARQQGLSGYLGLITSASVPTPMPPTTSEPSEFAWLRRSSTQARVNQNDDMSEYGARSPAYGACLSHCSACILWTASPGLFSVLVQFIKPDKSVSSTDDLAPAISDVAFCLIADLCSVARISALGRVGSSTTTMCRSDCFPAFNFHVFLSLDLNRGFLDNIAANASNIGCDSVKVSRINDCQFFCGLGGFVHDAHLLRRNSERPVLV